MPLPRSVARFNKRYTNRYFVRLLARTPGFTIIEHRGRKSGTAYETPVYIFDAGNDSFVVSLTYGPTADWAQNVLVNGGALVRNGSRQPITDASIVARSEAWSHLPAVVRVWLRILKVSDFMLLHT